MGISSLTHSLTHSLSLNLSINSFMMKRCAARRQTACIAAQGGMWKLGSARGEAGARAEAGVGWWGARTAARHARLVTDGGSGNTVKNKHRRICAHNKI